MPLTDSDRTRLERLNTAHLRLMQADRKRLTESGEIIPLDALDRMSRKHIVGAIRQCQHRFDMYPGQDQERPVVLELGPGRGIDRSYLETALDASYLAIDAVEETAGSLGGCVYYGPIEHADTILKAEGEVQFIYSRHVMEHTVNVDMALGALKNILAENGIIGAVTPYLFPDPEPAHTTKLDLEGWTAAYARHGLLVVYGQVVTFRVAELHIVAVRKDWPGLAEKP